MATKVSEKVQEAIFTQLLNTPANSECADCCTTSPTWVSLDFGVFLCMRCSGVHRQIGPHITRVRSVRLDGWTKDNIEIMATVGNKISNDFYEHSLTSKSRKPKQNSSVEDCRRFVDEKYISKRFAPAGFQEPVKEFIACRKEGTKPDFSYSTQASSQQQQQQPQKQEAHPRNHSTENPHGTTGFGPLRKKSMSLDKIPNKNAPHTNTHNNHNLLSPDEDLLGGDVSSHVQTTSIENKHSHAHIHAHSASPAKLDFAKFKKGTPNLVAQSQSHTPSTSQWNPEDLTGNNNQVQNSNQNGGADELLGFQGSNQQQQQQQPQIDLKQLYNQGHQNHFMQNQSRQNWNYQGMNPGFQGGFNGGYNQGNTNTTQNNGNFMQMYGQQGYNQQMGGYPQQTGYNGNVGGMHQMGYNQGYGANQHGYNQYQSNGFVQVQNNNQFF